MKAGLGELVLPDVDKPVCIGIDSVAGFQKSKFRGRSGNVARVADRELCMKCSLWGFASLIDGNVASNVVSWRTSSFGLMAAALLLVFQNPASAQLAGTGAISGAVVDPSGAVISGATVTAINSGTNVRTTRTTTSSGDYNVTPLTPGNYVVTVTARGFQKFRQENVTVNALATVTLNVKMTVGEATETVTVTSAPPLLDTTDATLGAVMDNEMYSNLPLLMGANGNNDQRRATDFEYLMPGVQQNYTNGNPTDNSGIVNGSGPKGGVSDIYLDGLDMPAADGVGDPRFTWTAIGVDSIDQFQVQTAGYSAQYGGQGVQNYSVKSGTNAYHGSIYEYLRNTMFDAWPFTAKTPTLNGQGQTVAGGIKPREIMNEFGIVLSGPIWKNRIFLFGNYGQFRNQNGAVYSALTIPTAAMLGYSATGQRLGYADFRGYAAANGGVHIYDPATQVPNCASCARQQFSGQVNGVPTPDVIPASRISKASDYYNKFLLPYESLANQTLYTNNLTYGTPTGLANWYSTGRIDFAQSSRNELSFIVAFGRQSSTGLNSGSGLLPPFNTSQTYHPVTTVDMIKDVFTISPNVINQFNVGFGRYQSDSVTPNWQTKYAAATAGIPNMPAGQAAGGFPKVTFSGTYSNPEGSPGKAQWGGYSFNDKINNTYNVMDNVQWVHGKHNFTFGEQYVDMQFNYVVVVSPSGPMGFQFSSAQTAAFTSGTSTNSKTGSAVASYLLGAVNSSSTTADVPGLGTRWRDPSFWAEDDYKATQNLTINLGLRWDIFPSIQEAHNYFSFLNPNETNAITGNKGTLEFAGSGDRHTYCDCSSPAPTYMKNIAPRFGISYALNPKTVVRGSYDVAYARGNWTDGSQSGSPSTLGFSPSASAPGGVSSAPAFYWDNTACAAGTNNGVPCGWTGSIKAPAPPAGGASLAEYGTGNTTTLGKSSTSLTYFDPYRGSRTPEFENWSFGIQRELTRDMSLTVSYVGSQGHFIGGGPPNPYTTNHLTRAYAAMAGYNWDGTTATPCSGASCGYDASGSISTLLAAQSTIGALAAASGLGFKAPNPYTKATYYNKNSVYQYYVQYPQFNGVSDTTTFTGNTAYHALEISLRQRNSHRLNFMLNYTYSKSIDDVGTFRVYDNPRLDRSLSASDQPQNLTSTAVYQLPFGHGHFGGDNFWANAFGGGWRLSGIFSYHSGTPLTVTGTGCGGSSILNQCMPNVVAGVKARVGDYGKNVTADPNSPNYYAKASYLDPAAFYVNSSCGSAKNATSCPGYGTNNGQLVYVGNGPQLYVPGNAPRVGADNVWSMSGYDLDLGLKRIFALHESLKLQFEADMRNVTNHVIWGAVNGGVGGSSYGTVTSVANQPRSTQFAARLMW